MRRKLVLRKLDELRGSVERGVPHNLTFKPFPGNDQQRKSLQKALDESFDRWRETWIFPCIDLIKQLVEHGK